MRQAESLQVFLDAEGAELAVLDGRRLALRTRYRLLQGAWAAAITGCVGYAAAGGVDGGRFACGAAALALAYMGWMGLPYYRLRLQESLQAGARCRGFPALTRLLLPGAVWEASPARPEREWQKAQTPNRLIGMGMARFETDQHLGIFGTLRALRVTTSDLVAWTEGGLPCRMWRVSSSVVNAFGAETPWGENFLVAAKMSANLPGRACVDFALPSSPWPRLIIYLPVGLMAGMVLAVWDVPGAWLLGLTLAGVLAALMRQREQPVIERRRQLLQRTDLAASTVGERAAMERAELTLAPDDLWEHPMTARLLRAYGRVSARQDYGWITKTSGTITVEGDEIFLILPSQAVLPTGLDVGLAEASTACAWAEQLRLVRETISLVSGNPLTEEVAPPTPAAGPSSVAKPAAAQGLGAVGWAWLGVTGYLWLVILAVLALVMFFEFLRVLGGAPRAHATPLRTLALGLFWTYPLTAMVAALLIRKLSWIRYLLYFHFAIMATAMLYWADAP